MAIDEKKLIDADKLIEDLIPILQNLDNPYVVGRIIGCINIQPSLTFEIIQATKTSDKDVPDNNVGKWHPVSDPPKKTGWYLITDSRGELDFDYFFAGEPNHSWRCFRGEMEKTIAWCDAKPYKGE